MQDASHNLNPSPDNLPVEPPRSSSEPAANDIADGVNATAYSHVSAPTAATSEPQSVDDNGLSSNTPPQSGASSAQPSAYLAAVTSLPPIAAVEAPPLVPEIKPAVGEAPAVEAMAPEQPVAKPVVEFVEPLAPAGTPEAALKPIATLLAGGVLACILVGLGMVLGMRQGSGVVSDPVAYVGGGAHSGATPESGNAIVRAVRTIGPAVMNVDTEFSRGGGSSEFLPNPGAGNAPQQGKGTGVVINSRKGYMLTNAHVVAGAQKIQVTTRDGNSYTGRLIGSDRLSDIAVVELSNKTLKQAKLANITDVSKDIAIGEWAIAIGNPYAQANTVTVGVVSAVGRTIPVPGGKDGQPFQLTDMLQTDAAINPGNSGGPLCNIHGEVIGINTAIIPFATGLGFTIPINKAMNVADQIIKKGRVSHPYVGIRMLPISDDVQKDFGLPDKNGAFVQSVEPNSPASRAQVQAGDVVRRVDGKPVKDATEVQRLIGGRKVGDIVKLEILRNNTVKRTLSIKIGDRPNG